MVLIDTSIWIESFRKPNPMDVRRLADFDEVTTCLPVIQEVLQGFREEGPFRIARDAMLALPIVESPLRTEVVEEAVSLYRIARRNGLTVRSSIDCLVAACAIRHDLLVIHKDRDYTALAKVSVLRQRAVG